MQNKMLKICTFKKHRALSLNTCHLKEIEPRIDSSFNKMVNLNKIVTQRYRTQALHNKFIYTANVCCALYI